MVVRVGINGFGRIGRIIFRTGLQSNDIELSAINDPAITAEYICYLIKFDSTHGRINKAVNYATDDEITVEDKIIKIFHEKMPSEVPWHTAGVQYVIEASGMFTTLEKAAGHLQNESVKRVIVTAPSPDIPMLILGVNDVTLRPEHKVLSCASSTLYCLAPIIKLLEDQFGISEGFVTSIHAMTPSLKPLDGLCLRGKHWRDHRSIHQNIIPATTSACKALGKIIPQLKDKMSGLAFRIPIVNVSVLDITVRLKSNTTLQDIVTKIGKASNTHMKNIIKISNDETVSSDYIGESHSCVFDCQSSLELKPNFYKLICWYENEYSYACRVIDSIFFLERQLPLVKISSKMTYVRTKPSKKYDVVQQTECITKEISVECKHSVDLSGTSQDLSCKIKEPLQNAILKKPLSAHTRGIASSSTGGRDIKRKNEIFKIWNDSNISKSSVRQNREAFFHSCISFAPPDTQPSNKKENKSENEKWDMSEVTNIDDELHNKPCNYKSEANPNSINCSNKVNQNFTAFVDIAKAPTLVCNRISHKNITNIRTFDNCRDYENNMNAGDSKVVDGCGKEEIIETPNMYNKEISDNRVVQKNNSYKQEADKCIIKSKSLKNSHNLKSGTSKIYAAKGDLKISSNNNAFKEQVAKAINTLIDGLEQSFQVSCQFDQQNSRINSMLQVKENFKKNFTREKKNDAKKTRKDIINQDIILQKSEKENCLVNLNTHDNKETKSKKEKNNLNTAIGSSTKIIHLNNDLYKTQMVHKTTIHNITNGTHNKDSDKYFAEKLLDGLNRVRADTVEMIPEDKAKPSIPESTSGYKNIINNVPKQDIFDKLESVSDTDSENSFDIHGRKSQVIHITDLTKSLEDLANLDKLCRIIEISDELSDKLFSGLTIVDGQDQSQKKWSFKDLCERINLDEFCNKVFGKTAL